MGASEDVRSRGGEKLEAAVELFGLGPAIDGAAAVDVGASTGGFTAALLRHGARTVVAVDVGHGQLHASLRADRRVTSLEGADWKKLALAEAPGPFDFFTVDVSFVAARNMLRGLAFRLRDGAQGVVLVKPQFELPSCRVRAGAVADPQLRRAALDRFGDKARALGFEVRGATDSPVPGGSGTIEILTWLRFAGRPATMPRPGERRPTRAARARPRAAADGEPREPPWSWFAIAGPGLEDVAAAEVAALPEAADVRRVDGGVEFAGPLALGLRANLWLRTATRVVARLGTARARDFNPLRRALARLPWERFVGAETALKIGATASRCRLYHTGALAETAALAIADRVKGWRADRAPEAGQAAVEPLTVLLRGVDDTFTASVDSSGERLHRRGFRVETAVAPLRETLAAGLLDLCGWDGSSAFCDPMCGAGTIALEACARALNVAPGLQRAFAFEAWPVFDAGARAIWEELLAKARAAVRARAAAPIAASDRDPGAIEIARRNAARAGVADHLALACIDLADVRPPAASGLVLLNPPYGRRLDHAAAATRLYRDIGRTLRAHFRGWRVGLLAASAAAASASGLHPTATHRLSNGGRPITLLVADL